MSGLDFTAWATILGTWLLVVVTLAFSYWQLRQAQRLHSATTILELRERFFSPRIRRARRELSTWLLQPTRGEEPDDWEVGIFFELMGALTRTRVLEKRLVWNAFGSWIVAYYEFLTKPENLIAQWRKDSRDPVIFAEFEWLARAMMEFDRRLARGPLDRPWELTDSRYILESESHLRPVEASGPGGP